MLVVGLGDAAAQAGNVDYDASSNGLIEVDNLAKLNAIRWDLDGNGSASAGNQPSYAAASPNALPGMGCAAAS